MNHWFVHYCDGYYDDGDLGFESFRTKEQALEFINDRLEYKGVEANIEDYTLIEGEERKLEAVEVTVKVRVKQ